MVACQDPRPPDVGDHVVASFVRRAYAADRHLLVRSEGVAPMMLRLLTAAAVVTTVCFDPAIYFGGWG